MQGRSVAASYEEAVKECEAKVAQIVAECKQNNVKYTDTYFDLNDMEYCLDRLEGPPPPEDPIVLPTSIEAEELGQKPEATPAKAKKRLGGTSSNNNKNKTKKRLGWSRAASGGPACSKRIPDIFDDPKFYVDGANIRDIRQGAEGDVSKLHMSPSASTNRFFD